MFPDTLVLATSWIGQPARERLPARTLLVGAATLNVRQRFHSWSFDLAAHGTTVTDNPAGTLVWLTERLSQAPTTTLVWRADDIVVPSLIAAAETERETLAAARFLRQLQQTFTGEVIDVAEPHGGGRATSFDAVAHAAGLPFLPMTRTSLAEAHRTGCHGDICQHLASRAKAMWQLWLQGLEGSADLIGATSQWLVSPDAQVRL